jgi:hypothetical protein
MKMSKSLIQKECAMKSQPMEQPDSPEEVEEEEEKSAICFNDSFDSDMDSSTMGGRKIAATIDRFKNAGATNEYIERQSYCHTENKPPQASQFWVDLIANVYDWISNAQ